MTEIVVRNLFKDYGTSRVLEHVNATLPDHEFCVVLGPSGAGKTTFLRLLLSQEQPTRGEILIDGSPIDPEPQPDRGVVFQRYSVFPHRTVLQNVVMGVALRRAPILGRLFGGERKEVEARARELLAQVGLAEAVDKYPAQLSGGMQQRLAIAQALIMEPKVLLLDEPFGALDQSTRRSMHRLILDLWEANHMTIVMVTHDIQEAFTLGTRVLMIDRQRREEESPDVYGSTITHDVRLDPATKPELDRSEGESDDSMHDIFDKWVRRMGEAVISDTTDGSPASAAGEGVRRAMWSAA